MKKALALLVAFATAFSISLTAFADAMPQGMANDLQQDTADNAWQGVADDLQQGAAGDQVQGANDTLIIADSAANNRIGINPTNLEVGDASGQYSMAAGEIFYVWTDGPNEGLPVLPGAVLTPDNEYVFDIYRATTEISNATPTQIVDEGNSAKILKSQLDGGRLRVRTVKGATSIASASLKETGSGSSVSYRLEVTTKANYGTKLSDVQYDVELTGGGSGAVDIVKSGVVWQVGFRKMLDDTIEDYEEGDTITIYNDRPVISKKQFETIAKNFNYRTVIFEDEEATWTFTGRVSGMADTNFYNTQEIIPNVVMDNPDTDFKFINFHGGAKFPTNGEMRIDVSDISDDFSEMHVYLSRGGALTPISATHDRETDEIVFKTNYLGTFIIADEVIETAIEEPEPTEPTNPEDPDSPYAPNPTNPTNPGTGASDAMNLITTLGVAALTGAGAVLRKRK